MNDNQHSDGAKPKRRMSEASLANLKGGSRKGIPNKVTKAAKEVIAQAAEELGGVTRLVEWAQENPENEGKFWSSIYPKLIPVTLANAEGENFRLEQVNEDADAFDRAFARLEASLAAAQTQH